MKARKKPAPEYRQLASHEIVSKGDQYRYGKTWRPATERLGHPAGPACVYRREVKTPQPTAQPSRGPWRRSSIERGDEYSTVILTDRANLHASAIVAKCGPHDPYISPEEAEANAEMIVHRVNNWPVLLAQLDSLTQMTANILDRAEREFPVDRATRTRLAKAQALVETLTKATL